MQLKSEFVKYFAALLSSNVLAQIIGFAAYPFITRIYGKEIFGEFNLFFSIVGILTIISTGKYESAIILPKSEKKALALFQLSILINIVLFIIISCFVFAGKEFINLFFSRKEWLNLLPLLPLLPFLVLLGGFWQSLNYYFIRQKKYYAISVYNISQSLINSGLKCLLGIKGLVHSGLIWGTFLGQLSAFFLVFFKSKCSFRQVCRIKKTEIACMAKHYSNFPKYQLPNELINTFAGNLPILLLSVYFEMSEIGLFSLALVVSFRPINILCNSIYQIMFKKMSERLNNKENIRKEIFLFCKVCMISILPCFILLMFISEWIFSVLFGMAWKESGLYLKYMLPWLFMVILVASIGFIPDLFFKQKTAMNIEIIYLIFRVASLFTGIYLEDFRIAILLYCSVSTVMLIVKLGWYFRLIKKYEQKRQQFSL
jgi:O-antigen/teichoic acid export membrane protein